MKNSSVKIKRNKEDILRIMKNAYEDDSYMLVGEQLIGPNDLPRDMLARYRKASGGELPAIMGIDFGTYGMYLKNIVGTDKWSAFIDQIVEYAEQGGIVTASHHLANPTGDINPTADGVDSPRGAFGDGSINYWDELLREGSEINSRLKAELILAGKLLSELDGRGVPVLFRPLHEANGNWFWFCAKSPGKPVGVNEGWTPADRLIKLWRYIYELYVNEMGLKNLIWVYGPNVGDNGTYTQDVMYYYPGDYYVDMVGIDWYTEQNSGLDLFNGHSCYNKLMDTGKPVAITEFGPAGALNCRNDIKKQKETFNSVDILNLMKHLTVVNGMKCAYMLTWHEGYGAFSSMGFAKEALSDPFFCTLRRLNERKYH